MYELICGEGRLIAHRRLGGQKLTPKFVTCTRDKPSGLTDREHRPNQAGNDGIRAGVETHEDEGCEFAQIAESAAEAKNTFVKYVRLSRMERND